MNRTIKEATVKRFHYDSHDQLRTHLADFLAAYNFARRVNTLGGLTPCEYVCKIWTSEPDRHMLDSIHQMPGLNAYPLRWPPRIGERVPFGCASAGLHLSLSDAVGREGQNLAHEVAIGLLLN